MHNVKPKLGSINKSLDNLEINLHSKSYFNVVVCDALFDCEPGHICEGGQCVGKYLSFYIHLFLIPFVKYTYFQLKIFHILQ